MKKESRYDPELAKKFEEDFKKKYRVKKPLTAKQTDFTEKLKTNVGA